jgi:hypothetical protein
MFALFRAIWAKDGVKGFSKGFSAAFYGALGAGFTYFFLYKLFKTQLT